MVVSETITWIASRIVWSILKVLSMMGIDWAKEKFRRKIKVEIDGKLGLEFATETAFPAAWLNFKAISKSDVDLTPIQIVAWVLLGAATIDKISWSRQESIFTKSVGINMYHRIPDVPATENAYFRFYYPLPPHVDFGKYELCLFGAIEFDCVYGKVVKNFQTSRILSEDEWRKAMDKWKEEYKGKSVIMNLTNL